MTLSRTCCLFLLLSVSARWSVGAVDTVKQGCIGDYIELFHNIQVDGVHTVLILYVNGHGYKQIAVWFLHNFIMNSTFLNGYGERIGIDQYGNIWIRGLQDSDEGNYIIECTTRNGTKKDNVTLYVSVAPDTRCRPKIIRGEDTLTTYLEPDGCGKPASTAYWLEQPGISVDRNVIKLLPGQEAGTVYACINSPALRCAKNSKFSDYCTVFKDEGKIKHKVTDLSPMTIGTLVGIIIVLFVIIVGIPILIIQCRRLKDIMKKNAKMEIRSDAMPLLSANGNLSNGAVSISNESGVDTQGSVTIS
ncbi:hypothetical protein CHS0354_002930 [Potamilus streckersoni]|uniref:Ig-like domain-containing protein n=1 Tax=Potamilus streckersoni TaxID=2493646 RepID=A0AAE0SY82_9BIVA|nr:hypothetical protein CHS0354_002930 [Potamilus streckersoni]